VLENPDYAAQILEEANLKELRLIGDETTMVKPRFKPDAKKIGARAGKNLKAIAQALESAAALPKSVLIEGEAFELAAEEIIVTFEGPANLVCMLEQGTFLALDKTITPELEEEGIARDFNRLMQDQRKALDLNISDRIELVYDAAPRIVHAIEAHADYLKNELLATRLERAAGDGLPVKLALAGEEIRVSMKRA
jgi:isoleucyl-tRNA synthetase